MRRTILSLNAALFVAGCGSAITPKQPDGHDCNYAEATTACGPRSYCDPGEPVGNQGYARRHTWGFFGDKTHVVGTCTAKGATNAPCHIAEGCVSGRCVHATPASPGVCE